MVNLPLIKTVFISPFAFSMPSLVSHYMKLPRSKSGYSAIRKDSKPRKERRGNRRQGRKKERSGKILVSLIGGLQHHIWNDRSMNLELPA
ncbi:hypothetical protein VNO77_46804 [Canavalia gladiata]|uniref:Uncharacterized protein n=1 Tax=Canavalia gladiata TaxID=3824 RepID=A0AAN9JHI5_CANGL